MNDRAIGRTIPVLATLISVLAVVLAIASERPWGPVVGVVVLTQLGSLFSAIGRLWPGVACVVAGAGLLVLL